MKKEEKKKRSVSLIINAKTLYSLFPLLPILFYFANLYRMLNYSSLPYRLSIGVFGLIGVYLMCRTRRQNLFFSLFAIVYFISGLFSALTIGNIAITDLMTDVMFFGIAYIMLTFPPTYRQGVITFYIMFCIFFFYYLIDADTHVLLTSSGNYISVLLIIAACIYYISFAESGRKMTVWDIAPAFLCFFLSIWAKGRAGILSTGILLALILIQMMNSVQDTKHKRVFGILFILIGGAVIFFLSDFSFTRWFFSLGKWRTRGTDNTERLQLIINYFEKLRENPGYVLFGAPLDQIPSIASVGKNCHNSFLQLHANNGIIMAVFLIIYTFYAFVNYIKYRRWMLASIFLVFCIRAFTDKFVFGQYGMPLMLYFIFRPMFEYRVYPISQNMPGTQYLYYQSQI